MVSVKGRSTRTTWPLMAAISGARFTLRTCDLGVVGGRQPSRVRGREADRIAPRLVIAGLPEEDPADRVEGGPHWERTRHGVEEIVVVEVAGVHGDLDPRPLVGEHLLHRHEDRGAVRVGDRDRHVFGARGGAVGRPEADRVDAGLLIGGRPREEAAAIGSKAAPRGSVKR